MDARYLAPPTTVCALSNILRPLFCLKRTLFSPTAPPTQQVL